MSETSAWLAAAVTAAVLAVHLLASWAIERRQPLRAARSAHAMLREQWFVEVSAQTGSEVLAVQTLRNSLMSATMTASTAVLGLIGTVTLAAPSLRAGLVAPGAQWPHASPQLVLTLGVMALLFASLACSTIAIRYFNHVSFIVGMPVGSAQRRGWTAAGIEYMRRAGRLYGWALRDLLLVAPLLASLMHPWAGPVAAVLLVAMLRSVDRAAGDAGQPPDSRQPG